jgi:hypothetical protein
LTAGIVTIYEKSDCAKTTGNSILAFNTVWHTVMASEVLGNIILTLTDPTFCLSGANSTTWNLADLLAKGCYKEARDKHCYYCFLHYFDMIA